MDVLRSCRPSLLVELKNGGKNNNWQISLVMFKKILYFFQLTEANLVEKCFKITATVNVSSGIVIRK